MCPLSLGIHAELYGILFSSSFSLWFPLCSRAPRGLLFCFLGQKFRILSSSFCYSVSMSGSTSRMNWQEKRNNDISPFSLSITGTPLPISFLREKDFFLFQSFRGLCAAAAVSRSNSFSGLGLASWNSRERNRAGDFPSSVHPAVPLLHPPPLLRKKGFLLKLFSPMPIV